MTDRRQFLGGMVAIGAAAAARPVTASTTAGTTAGTTASPVIQGSQVVSVKDVAFGAQGDGITDDSAAIQAAIDRANSIYFPIGTYLIGTPLTLPNHYQQFIGAGRYRTILKPNGVSLFNLPDERHGLHWSQMAIVGNTGAEIAFALNSSGSNLNDCVWDELYFNNLAFAFDTAGGPGQFISNVLRFCQFDNAPCRWSGAASHIANLWDRCRWSGTRAGVVACALANTLTTDANNVFRRCLWESNHRQHLQLQGQVGVVLDAPYLGQWDLDGAGLPGIDCIGAGGNKCDQVTIRAAYIDGSVSGDPIVIGCSTGTTQGSAVWQSSFSGPPTQKQRNRFSPLLEIGGADFPASIGNPAGAYLQLDDSATGALLNSSLGSAVQLTATVSVRSPSAFMVKVGNATQLKATTTGLGFFGVAPVAKPVVSGSRGGNAALASLIAALANLGLITDHTT